MTTEAVDMGSISSRGQIAIPTEIRKILGLDEGSKVLFVVENDTLMMKKVTAASFAELTRPLRESAKNINEEDVTDLIHKVRNEKKRC
jgi:antitoxin PrlF